MIAASCYSSNARRETVASVQLVSGLSDKLADYCRAGFAPDGRPVTAEEMGEFYYGLQKARSFERMTAADSSQPWHQAFARMVETYAAFLQAADQYRLNSTRTQDRLDALLKDHELVRRRVADVMRALDAKPHSG